ncbi:GNAT family N-acetyltransferase [Rhodopseudomonas sp. WA056]|uniref:GNAT family N-acetyltransferase n=1 Tax=Rhodopseudomonas sp. WA056 TaxID=2269367 RepID=UPI0013DE8EAF|nr:GNAT family N-acetyltransferase [Rhodopseudomonas sp. WA056]NEW87941.1 GNAT family N-acetyltransferase [Rhodopseudomonas sp. WA056]
MLLRPARSDDFDSIQKVEIASFATLQKAGAIDGTPSSSTTAQLQDYLDHALLYVACGPTGATVGFCGGYVAGRFLHVGEMDVLPGFQRRGLGRRLLTTLLDEARARMLDGATLTTDRFAPFNAPFYATFGFRVLEGDHLPERLRKILDAEIESGLDRTRRVGMALRF